MNKIKKYAGVAVLSSMIVGSVHASNLSYQVAEWSHISHTFLTVVDLGLDLYSIIKEDDVTLTSMDTVHALGNAYGHWGILRGIPYIYYPTSDDRFYETSKGDLVLHALNGAVLVKTWSEGQRMDALLAHNAITQLLLKEIKPEKIVQGEILSKVGRLALWSGAAYHIGKEYGYSLKGMIEDPHMLHTSLSKYLIVDDIFYVKHGSIVDHLMGRSGAEEPPRPGVNEESIRSITDPDLICNILSRMEELKRTNEIDELKNSYHDDYTHHYHHGFDGAHFQVLIEEEIADRKNGYKEEMFLDIENRTCEMKSMDTKYDDLTYDSSTVKQLDLMDEKIHTIHHIPHNHERTNLLRDKVAQGGGVINLYYVNDLNDDLEVEDVRDGIPVETLKISEDGSFLYDNSVEFDLYSILTDHNDEVVGVSIMSTD